MCVHSLQLQNNSSESVDHARNALRLLCHDGAAGVDVARDEALQLRPLGERHHQGGGRGSLLDLGPSRWCHGEGSDGEGGDGGGGGLGNGGGCGDRDGGGGDGDGGGGLGDDGGGGGDSTRREVARGSTGSLGGNLSPHPWALLSGGRPRGQLALYKVAPRRDSGKLLPILDCSSWEDSPEQSTTLTPLAAATRSCRCRVCAAAAR